MTEETDFDVTVVGAGPAGLATGFACSALGLKTAVIGPLSDPRDGRTAALFDASITLLKRIGVWQALAPVSEPLRAMRLIDATGALLRAPEVMFRSSEIGLDAFGYNVPVGDMTEILERLAPARFTRIISAGVTGVALAADAVTLTTAEARTVRTRLAAAADGRNSMTRAAAGIGVQSWRYDQAALITTFNHTRPHQQISTEFHGRAGPLVLVPGPGNVTSIVWVERPAEAARLAELPETAFAQELAGHMHNLLGTLSGFTPRRVFQLSGQTAEKMAQNRVALIGETAHVIPPIGAQGLNLSLRDAATLAECAAEGQRAHQDAGHVGVQSRYDDARRGDITSRVWTVDLLNKSLISPYLPVHLARGFGLFALSALGPLRRHVMREGVSPQSARPSLMRPGALLGESAPGALDGAAARRA